MRKQLIVTIEEELIPQWKAEAKSQGVSLSLLIERRMTVGHKKPKRFADFFKGKPDLEPDKSADQIKGEYLQEKYG